MITIHNNKEDYTPEEAHLLEEAYNAIASKQQGEMLTIDDTRIIVAFKRFKQEQNFKIVAVKVKKEKVVKEKVVKEKVVKTKKKQEADELSAFDTKKADILYRRHIGAELSEEDKQFIEDLFK